ncbi:hypothetical protein AAFF_G00371720 [Aldrovandia affinis]|uniref:Uncharacterized protein n=1 Tax=Aldrovandia affinis TaxID=143900 RepID=A0AAD7SHE2_9TELE|nr:hypothetical protein AAFF_G00371720 [Aldrovandia affinis]
MASNRVCAVTGACLSGCTAAHRLYAGAPGSSDSVLSAASTSPVDQHTLPPGRTAPEPPATQSPASHPHPAPLCRTQWQRPLDQLARKPAPELHIWCEHSNWGRAIW